ncbi:MAG: ketoacyl-ACP synthase III [Cryomorphaceae bacterium]|nr:ketoacyl-ACP synthase III [Cryomorphaceae bacterium]
MYSSKISGVGHYVPERVVTNDDLSKIIDTNDAWITERTGIKERRFADLEAGETPSVMGTKAAELALKRANISKHDIDFIIFATLSPDYYFPGPGVMVQDQLGIGEIGALDVRNQCSGFVYGLSVADQFIKTGMYKNILLIGAELHSGGLDMTSRGRGVSVIFGDGAGAVVISRAENGEEGILSTHMHSEGKYAKELALLSPNTSHWVPEIMQKNDPEDLSYYPYMNGNFVFKHAVVRFSEVIEEALQTNNCSVSDIDLLIPHQANLRISQFIQKKMGMRDDQVFNNIMKYGNTTAASIPIAMSEAWEEGRLQPGKLICLAAFGSGFTWASALLRWH